MTDDLFRDPRRDKNTKHELTGMLRQSVYRRLAGYKDTNDAERLAVGCVCNMTYQEAVDLAGAVDPRLTIPTHFDMFENNSEDPQLFLDYLRGNWQLECTPWGNPTYNVFGWQRPCYLLDEGYCETFQELLETTQWDEYGHRSGNPKCTDCMVHCGHEPTAVMQTFGTWTGFLRTVRLATVGANDRPLPTGEDAPLHSSNDTPDAAADLQSHGDADADRIELPILS